MRAEGCSDFVVDIDEETAQRLSRVGRAHIIIGLLCCVSHAARLKTLSKNFYLSQFQITVGFFSAFLFIVTGFLGTASRTSRKKCTVVAFSISSATSAMTCWSLFGLFFFYSELVYAGYSQDLNEFTVSMMQLSMLCLVVFETIVSVWSAIVCCGIGTIRSQISKQGP